MKIVKQELEFEECLKQRLEFIIENEAMFDGFYAVCTTFEDDISEIIKVNKRR